MDIAGSLSSPLMKSINRMQNINLINNEDLTLSSDDYSNDMLAVSYEIIQDDEVKPDISDITVQHENKVKQVTHPAQYKEKQYTVVSYGPIKVRVSTRPTPTLQSGRRSKFAELDAEASAKREFKREKNRQVARKLKEKYLNIESELLEKLNELESGEKELIEKVNNLTSYKEFLTNRCQQQIKAQEEIIEKASSNSSQEKNQSQQTQKHIFIQREFKSEPIEPRSPSPNWQLHFSISS
ncbi:unnamed protein product [Adineta steineri]|uniref:BZIP domain-containing protein n=1 Tax=Adineta steineri TaxID=433720 RepID=A0A818GGB1_9BILA|nr:unnamed protein product [Adineta steineri]CAF3489394.1 unnamed protein product [Adineta steineri]